MLKRFFLFIAAVGLLVLLAASPALASPGLTVGHVGGKGLSPEVSPGESYSWTLLASIGKDDAATDVLIEVLGYGENPDSGVQPLLPEEDKSHYSARTFIQPGRITLHVEPGETKQVEVTVTIPADVGSGGRYAILRFSTAPLEEEMVKIVSAIVLPLKFTIKGSQLLHQGRITELTTSDVVSGQPVDILTTFQNTGNHHFKVKGEVTISNAAGETLDTIYLALTSSSVIPTMSRRLKATFIPEGELPLGVYSIKSKIMFEDGTILDEASTKFEVGKPYVPPPPPASLTAAPSSTSVLKTDDGRISISFPQGAFISQAQVALRSYPLEQLPSPPEGFKIATTCFRVDGLTGLLAKEAAVTVKYTAADLDKADGNVSRLKLARWDEATSQWSVLKTTVDKPAMTLTAATNLFSIWAVLVSPPTKMNWLVIGGAVIGAVIISSIVILLIKRRRQYLAT